jgi:hypothetical protein
VHHDFWRVSEDRLRRALTLSSGPFWPPRRMARTLCICSQTTYGR